MELIIFEGNRALEQKRFRDLNFRNKNVTRVTHFQTADGLMEHLATLAEGPRVVVLMRADQEIMSRLERRTEVLIGVQLVLVLADHQPESIRLGHSLHPRYLTFADVSRVELVGVLDGIVGATASR